jgi:hypothetical protein
LVFKDVTLVAGLCRCTLLRSIPHVFLPSCSGPSTPPPPHRYQKMAAMNLDNSHIVAQSCHYGAATMGSKQKSIISYGDFLVPMLICLEIANIFFKGLLFSFFSLKNVVEFVYLLSPL